MGFEVIHQPKSKDVFSFRVIPCHSVANLMLSCPPFCSMNCVCSVFFRVIPWLMLLLLLHSVFFRVHSVANASAYASFRVIPWQIFYFYLFFFSWLILFSCNLRPNMDISEIL